MLSMKWKRSSVPKPQNNELPAMKYMNAPVRVESAPDFFKNAVCCMGDR